MITLWGEGVTGYLELLCLISKLQRYFSFLSVDFNFNAILFKEYTGCELNPLEFVDTCFMIQVNLSVACEINVHSVIVFSVIMHITIRSSQLITLFNSSKSL